MQSGISHMHGVEASSLVIQLESQYQGGPSLWGGVFTACIEGKRKKHVGKGDTLAQRALNFPRQRVRGKLVWFWWASGSPRPQGTRTSVFVFNGTSGRD
eukprot:1141228-Pelagomonas_calceolata.AAC.1